VAVRAEPSVLVQCGECADYFELSRRNVREHERRGVPHKCARCRGVNPGPSPAAIEQAREWWLRRYTLAELQSWPHI
jgi:hypothetical protein